MKRALLYSHDTFGMGNIRRMLAISEHLIETMPDVSILLITGSPVIHDLRLPERLDYIKLPSLTRTDADVYSAKTLGTEIEDTMRLRADLILAAAAHYKPDLVLIDKKPAGIKNELTQTLQYLKTYTQARIALILRDILDTPERTVRSWQDQGHFDRIRSFYDKVLVLGTPEIFDARREYCFPPAVAAKTVFCGYLGKRRATETRRAIRQQLGMTETERLILVTPGGGEDGHPIIHAYCAALPLMNISHGLRSLIITGPEMPDVQRRMISDTAASDSRVTCRTFVDNMMAYMEAADLIVSMGGYNTVCEILSTRRKAIVIPRVEPVQEQWIRATKMQRRGFFSVIDPRQLTPELIARSITTTLDAAIDTESIPQRLDLNALANVARWSRRLLEDASCTVHCAAALEPRPAIHEYVSA